MDARGDSASATLVVAGERSTPTQLSRQVRTTGRPRRVPPTPSAAAGQPCARAPAGPPHSWFLSQSTRARSCAGAGYVRRA